MSEYFEFESIEKVAEGTTFVALPRGAGKAFYRVMLADAPSEAAAVVDAVIIARGRAHWKKASDLYAEMLTADSDSEVAELARRMAAELYTYATYRDTMAGILYKGDSQVVNSWEGQE